MYHIILGSKLYGKVDQTPQGRYIATKFFYIQLIPLIPLGSYLVLDDSPKDDSQWVTVYVGWNWKSIFFGWLRGILWTITFLATFLTVVGLLVGGEDKNPPFTWTARGCCVGGALLLWVSYWLTRASVSRAMELDDQSTYPDKRTVASFSGVSIADRMREIGKHDVQ